MVLKGRSVVVNDVLVNQIVPAFRSEVSATAGWAPFTVATRLTLSLIPGPWYAGRSEPILTCAILPSPLGRTGFCSGCSLIRRRLLSSPGTCLAGFGR